ncbi:LRR receptor serine/threonine-protein kinase ERL1 [Trifolium repens]|nr:LRR receptor serine/threonine-protein kinase ERL1 [Trifolium repens]
MNENYLFMYMELNIYVVQTESTLVQEVKWLSLRNLSANNFKGNIPVELGHIVNLGTYLAIIFQAMSQLQMVI